MHLKRCMAVAAAAVAAVGLAGAGAYAATQSSSSNSVTPRQAFLSDLAHRLGVSQSKLTSAIEATVSDQLNAAVKAGRLTQTQADAIANRVKQGGSLGPIWFGAPPRASGGLSAPTADGPVTAAASYLGITRAQLLTQLRSGQTLAQIASSRGKSTAGLEQAIVASITSRLDHDVAAGHISSSQEKQILSTLSTRIADEINGKAPGAGFFGHHGFRGYWGHGGTTGPLRGALHAPAPAGLAGTSA